MQHAVDQIAALTPAPHRRRRLRALLPLALLTLILAQPLLCVAHCRLTAGHRHTHADGASGHFFCELMPQDAGVSLFVPAFWPGLLPTLIAPILALTALRRLRVTPTPPHALAAWPPLPPPPR